MFSPLHSPLPAAGIRPWRRTQQSLRGHFLLNPLVLSPVKRTKSQLRV